MNSIFKRLEVLVTNLKANNFKGAVIRLTAYYTAGVFCILLAFSFLVYGLFLVDMQKTFQLEHEKFEALEDTEEGDAGGLLSSEIAENLFDILLVADTVLLILTIGVSYVLARRTLAPLSLSYQKQKRFVADAAHELRTPLAVIKAGSEMLLQQDRTAEQYKKFIQESQEETNRLITLANDLLFLAQNNEIEKTSFQPFSLSELCTYQSSLILPYAHAKEIVVHTKIQPEIFIKGRKQDISRLILNLLKNAVDYNIPKGSVTVTLFKKQTQVLLSVQDTGIGIAGKDIPHVFERFYKADTSRSLGHSIGTGLGLSMVKEIVDAHGGAITVQSTQNKGTTIEVVFQSA